MSRVTDEGINQNTCQSIAQVVVVDESMSHGDIARLVLREFYVGLSLVIA